MAFDIEFLPVDSGARCGDAIAVQWTDNATSRVGVIDGGTKESGQALVDHIRKYYGNPTELDFVLNTHPDSDHASGLTVVLENFRARSMWMHQPWNYSADLLHLIEDPRVTSQGLERRLREKLARAYDLERLAKKMGIPIYEPFQGQKVGPFTVLSPSRDWYKELVTRFRNMPEAQPTPFATLKKAIGEAVRGVAETFDFETLREDGVTSAENDSSVILYGFLDGQRRVLLTADAGIEALKRAADYADTYIPGWNQPHLNAVQIPHHGSRRNVSPSILDRILGPRVTEGTVRGWAFASSSKASETHARKSVLNAFTRRGFRCCETKGATKRHYIGSERTGWSPIQPIPLHTEVEEYD